MEEVLQEACTVTRLNVMCTCTPKQPHKFRSELNLPGRTLSSPPREHSPMGSPRCGEIPSCTGVCMARTPNNTA